MRNGCPLDREKEVVRNIEDFKGCLKGHFKDNFNGYLKLIFYILNANAKGDFTSF